MPHSRRASGVTTVALFDVDGTLYDAEMGRELLRYLRDNGSVARTRAYLAAITPHYALYKAGIKTHESFVRMAVMLQGWLIRGWTIERGRQVFSRIIHERLLPVQRPPVVERLKSHVSRGHLVTLVSGMMQPSVTLLGDHFGVGAAIGTGMEIREGRYTGRLESRVVTGVDKEIQLRRHLEQLGVEPDWHASYAYGDAIQDAPLLSLVGNPVAVHPDQRLGRLAIESGWEVLAGG